MRYIPVGSWIAAISLSAVLLWAEHAPSTLALSSTV